jgi:hypothetical protein
MLSRAQFDKLAERANAPNGGYTVDVNTGREPKTGFMVSRAGGRNLRVPMTGADLERHAQMNAQELSKPGKFQGLWHPENRPVATADVTSRFSLKDSKGAAEMTVAEEQEAAYKAHPSLPYGGEDKLNPLHPVNAPAGSKRAMARVSSWAAKQIKSGRRLGEKRTLGDVPTQELARQFRNRRPV